MRILLLHGGWSKERRVSLMESQRVAKALATLGHDVICLDPKKEIHLLVSEAKKSDFVYHCLFEVNGTLEALLDRMGVPRTGSSLESLILAKSKNFCKELFLHHGIPTPDWEVVSEIPLAGWQPKIGCPLVAKPDKGGSSIGVFMISQPNELPTALDFIFDLKDFAILEKRLDGIEISCGVLDGEALPPILIRPKDGPFFNYSAKYTPGEAEEISPAPISKLLSHEIQKLAEKAHNALGLHGCSRTDFIIVDDQPYALEINASPGMTPNSLLPKEALAAGFTYESLIERLVELGLRRSANPNFVGK